MRVRLIWNNIGIVMPIPARLKSEKLSKLLQEAADRFRRHVGTFEEGNRFVEVTTPDGCSFSLNDTIEEVIADDDILTLVDYNSWKTKMEETCTEQWMSVQQEELTQEGDIRWAKVGYNPTYRKIWIGLGVNKKKENLELLDEEAFRNFAKPGRHLITRIGGNANASSNSNNEKGSPWYAEAYFLVEGDVAKAIALSVKASTGERPQVQKIGIEIKNGKFIKGPIATIQSAVLPPPSIKYKIPAPVINAPTIKLSPSQPVDFKGNKSKGDSPISLEQVDQVYPSQSWERDGVFDNFFFTEVMAMAPIPTSTVDITSAYEDPKTGQWVPAKFTQVGVKYGYYDYQLRSPEDHIIDVDPSPYKFVLCAGFEVRAPQLERNRRSHHFLPHPLKIKYTLTDTNNKKTELVVTHVNTEPLSLPTKEAIEKKYNVTLDFWQTIDDVDGEFRLWCGVEHNKEHHSIRIFCNDKSETFYYEGLRKRAYIAAQKGA